MIRVTSSMLECNTQRLHKKKFETTHQSSDDIATASSYYEVERRSNGLESVKEAMQIQLSSDSKSWCNHTQLIVTDACLETHRILMQTREDLVVDRLECENVRINHQPNSFKETAVILHVTFDNRKTKFNLGLGLGFANEKLNLRGHIRINILARIRGAILLRKKLRFEGVKQINCLQMVI
ncbi:unnamed protein product [Cylicocyclus nassatus]|uniref:Uncharacterized protein n=1 Tax=Cylicocyclus nassatus TaxID=53992 RepID=A0AA36MI54_CYLNA|nr:unnamed protein product [Cylicocyclus nassatus]